MIPAKLSGELKGKIIKQPTETDSVEVVKITLDGKLEDAIADEIFAKIECDETGRPVDFNFSTYQNVPELF